MTAERVGRTLYLLNISVMTNDLASIARPIESSIQEWHQRLAHLGYRTIIKMAESGAVDGLNLQPGTQPPLARCHECAVGKMKRLVFLNSSTPKATRIGSLIHSDVCGLMQVSSIGGALYYVLFEDDSSGFRVVRFIKQKSEVATCFKDFVSLLHAQTGQLVSVLRSDNGGEYENHELQAWLRKKGIRHETSVRLTSQQNGVAERDNLTLMEGARTLIHSNRNLPLTLWAEAVSCVTYTLNRTLSSTHFNKTPYEAWYGKKPNLSNLRIFGSEFYTLIPKEIRRKLDPKGLLCYFVGNSDTQKGDRYWDALAGKVNTSRDVTPSRHHYERGFPQEDRQNGLDIFPTSEPPAPSTPEVPTRQSKSTDFGKDRIVIEKHPTLSSLQPLSLVNEIRRSARVKARIEKDLNSTTAASALTYNEPDQYRDAMASDDAPFWSAAVDREINSLIKNRTWTIVRLPPDHPVIRSRWTFKFKPGYGQQEDIYKARFVAKGFSQVSGLDFNEDEIYSPVIKHD
jgi:transposase InsO family protein